MPEDYKREPEFQSIEQQDEYILKNADYFTAHRSYGRGLKEEIGPEKSLDDLLHKISEHRKNEDPRKDRGWLIYAVIEEGSRSSNVMSVNCKGQKEEDYHEFQSRIKAERLRSRKRGDRGDGD